MNIRYKVLSWYMHRLLGSATAQGLNTAEIQEDPVTVVKNC